MNCSWSIPTQSRPPQPQLQQKLLLPRLPQRLPLPSQLLRLPRLLLRRRRNLRRSRRPRRRRHPRKKRSRHQKRPLRLPSLRRRSLRSPPTLVMLYSMKKLVRFRTVLPVVYTRPFSFSWIREDLFWPCYANLGQTLTILLLIGYLLCVYLRLRCVNARRIEIA